MNDSKKKSRKQADSGIPVEERGKVLANIEALSDYYRGTINIGLLSAKPKDSSTEENAQLSTKSIIGMKKVDTLLSSAILKV